MFRITTVTEIYIYIERERGGERGEIERGERKINNEREGCREREERVRKRERKKEREEKEREGEREKGREIESERENA